MSEERNKTRFRNLQEWFAQLDKYNSEPFFFDREQPLTPERIVFEEERKDKHDA